MPPGEAKDTCIVSCRDAADKDAVLEAAELSLCELNACRGLSEKYLRSAGAGEAKLEELSGLTLDQIGEKARAELRRCADKHCIRERARCGGRI